MFAVGVIPELGILSMLGIGVGAMAWLLSRGTTHARDIHQSPVA